MIMNINALMIGPVEDNDQKVPKYQPKRYLQTILKLRYQDSDDHG